MNYWQECIECALDEAGLSATKEQIELISGAVEGAHENYGMAHGYDVIGRGAETEAEQSLRKLREQIDQKERWVNSTKPCKTCTTTGSVLDGWGRYQTCLDCDGKGRVR